MKSTFRSILFCSLLVASAAVAAQTANTTFQVTATVSSGCVISATNHDFGIYMTSSPTDNLNGSNTLTATCTLALPYTLALDVGTALGATAAARMMTRVGGTEMLQYSLYQGADRLVVLGNTVGLTLPGVGTGLAIDHTVFGKIPAGQNVPAGNYADTVTATIAF